MTAFNIVRFRVKPGREDEFLDAHRNISPEGFSGSRRLTLVKTGENTFAVIGEWDSFDSLAEARPHMISVLDTFRDCLEDLGGGLGVTDPVSGEAVFEASSRASKPRRTAPRKARKAPAKSRAAAKRAKPSARKKPGAKPSRKAGRKPARKTPARRARR